MHQTPVIFPSKVMEPLLPIHGIYVVFFFNLHGSFCCSLMELDSTSMILLRPYAFSNSQLFVVRIQHSRHHFGVKNCLLELVKNFKWTKLRRRKNDPLKLRCAGKVDGQSLWWDPGTTNYFRLKKSGPRDRFKVGKRSGNNHTSLPVACVQLLDELIS